jgi:hypothetical protein
MKLAAVLVDQRGASAGFFLLGLRYRHGRIILMIAFSSGPGLCRLSGNFYLCPTLCPHWHTAGIHVLLMRKSILFYSKYSAYLSQMRRANEQIRIADLISLRVRGQWLQLVA